MIRWCPKATPYQGDTAYSLANRAKIRLSAEEWNTIKAAIERGVAIPVDASKEVLLGYHYAFQRQSRKLAKEISEIQKRRDSAMAARAALHATHSNASYTNSRRHHRHGSRVENLDTQIGETSPKTSTRLSYLSMRKVISYRKHQKQCLLQHKHIYTPRSQAQGIQENI
jgi:hypothetical protein